MGKAPSGTVRWRDAGNASPDRRPGFHDRAQRLLPGLVSNAVASALGSEPVTAYVVHHDAIFDPGMEDAPGT